MMKIRNLVRDDQLVSCVISGSSGRRGAFAVLLELGSLRPETEIPPECRRMLRRALPAIRQALLENRIPSVSEGRCLSLSIPS